jgi:outer membrane receptor for ferric coprogen and ferric-rhodotorulic acid
MSTFTRCALVILFAWVPAFAAGAAGDERATYRFQIERQPLDAALREFARQSGVQLIYFSQLTEGLPAPGLEGRYTLTDALGALLAGSNLTFHVVNPNTVEIKPAVDAGVAGRAVAPPVSRSRIPDRPDTSGDNARALEQVVISDTSAGFAATRIETPLREIPQTVSIISSEQMREQNDTSLADALSRAVGITSVRDNSLEQSFAVRGYGITALHIDGSAALNALNAVAGPFFGTPDLSEFDHIELLRGADALFGADSDPGATVNLIRKRPLDNYRLSSSLWAGSWHNYRAELDVTGPLDTGNTLRGRLVGAYSSRDYFYDTATRQGKKIFGVLEYELVPQTLLTVGGSYQWDDATPFLRGLSLYVDGSDPHLPRSTAWAFDWSRYRTRTRELYLRLEHAFDSDWKLRFNVTSLNAAATYGYAELISPIDPVTRGLRYPAQAYYSARPNSQKQLALDATVTGALQLFGHRELVALGADFVRFNGSGAEEVSGGFGPVLSNVNNFDQRDFSNPRATQTDLLDIESRPSSRLSGIFATLKVYATDALSITGGARLSNGRYESHSDFLINGISLGPDAAKFGDSNKITPYGGVLYALTPRYTLYASYADVYRSVGGANGRNDAPIRPADGVVIEAGIKAAWREDALNGVLAIYRAKQLGLTRPDPAPPPDVSDGCCYLADASNLSRGVDAEISGNLAHGWLIGAGYTYNSNRDQKGAPLSLATPRHLAKLWTSSALPGGLSRWTLGGSVHAQSRNSKSGSYCARVGPFGSCFDPLQQFETEQRSYLTLDVRASYQMSANWRAALTVANVLDRRYYETVGTPLLGNWYGEPRSVLVRVDGAY